MSALPSPGPLWLRRRLQRAFVVQTVCDGVGGGCQAKPREGGGKTNPWPGVRRGKEEEEEEWVAAAAVRDAKLPVDPFGREKEREGGRSQPRGQGSVCALYFRAPMHTKKKADRSALTLENTFVGVNKSFLTGKVTTSMFIIFGSLTWDRW